MLHTAMSSYDGIHFTDPNLHTDRIAGGGSLWTSRDFARVQQNGAVQPDLNNPSSAYAGRGLLLFLGRESWYRDDLQVDASVFARFDVRKAVWVRPVVHETAWSNGPEGLRSSSELVTLRNPQTDEFQAVAIQQRGAPPYAVMCQAMIGGVTDGTPHLVPDLPIHNSLSRRNGEPIYGFRVMFDNGIYYLHYNDGPSGTVPDWPSWFVLTAALDPYTGPWVANPDTLTGAGYLSRGTPFQPDNAAIWQGCMFKFRGHYYLYYENFHAIGDVDAEYANYDALQVGSRVGYATG
jgi:hypothetical protein